MSAPPTFDPRALDQIRSLPPSSGGDFVARLVALYRCQSNETLPKLTAAVSDGDWPVVHRIAHAWKTSAGQVGAVALHELLRDLDDQARRGAVEGPEQWIERVAAEHERVLAALPER